MKPSDGAAGEASRARRVGHRTSSSPHSSHLRKELVEHRVYATATELFAKRGFAKTSLQDIADEMGITRSALYYYVKSKDDLLARLIAEITEGNTAQICAVADDATLDPVAKLSRIAHIMALNRALQPSRFLLLARSEAVLPADLSVIHETMKRVMLRALVGVIADGIDAGTVRPVDPRSAALHVIGMCNWIAWWFHEHDAASAEAVAADVADLALSSLVQSPGRAIIETGPRAAVKLLRRDLAYLENLLDDEEQRPDPTSRG